MSREARNSWQTRPTFLVMGMWSLLVGLLTATAARAGGSPAGGEKPSATRESGEKGRMELAPLFEAELQYRPDMAAVVSPEGRTGRLLGSGDGRITGPRVRGRFRWSIFEEQGAGECKTNIAGFIETDDGGRIGIETRGFGVVSDPSRPRHWRMSAAIQFRADGKYAWLQSVLAVWDGSFDMVTGRHSYRAYLGQ